MTHHTHTVFLGFGSNLGDKSAMIHRAIDALTAGSAMTLVASSSLYESPAMLLDGAPQSWNIPYLNAVAKYRTNLTPQEVLLSIKAQEAIAGRQDRGRWGPRELDIDLLAYDDVVQGTQELTLPHAGIAARDFVLLPWHEIAPDWQHPPIAALCTALPQITARRLA